MPSLIMQILALTLVVNCLKLYPVKQNTVLYDLRVHRGLLTDPHLMKFPLCIFV